ncbi:MAG TPA: oligoendopeptidase F [Candidatus Krumholzibacteria bacterium]|nr:oligoendopeptidase F [Candidatus Krumholzibacteria bacterium]
MTRPYAPGRPGGLHDDDEASAGGSPVERSAIDDRYKWRLDRIFPDWTAWEACYAEVEAALPGLAALQGTLAGSGAALLRAVEAMHAARRKLEQALVYAGMKSDEDTRIGENTARRGRVSSLAVRFAEAVSWFDSEVLAVPADRFAALMAEEPGLALYAHHFDDIQRARAHTLPAEQEALLASAGLMARGASQVFNAFDNADLVFPSITGENGKPVVLTKGRYQKLLKSRDRRVRREAYEAFLDAYGAMKNTLAANMDANVKNHVFYAQARDHAGTLEAALHPDAVPPSVFHALIGTVSANTSVIHRYTALKKRVLGLDVLHEYDLAVPLFPDGEFKFAYDEACGVMLDAFAPLGADYVRTVREGIEGGWIDVHESAGKRSGGYSNGVYDTPPFILLNWSDQLGDSFTLAHELGHSMHSFLAAKHQPYVYGDYPIFTAEVASTFNELLLMDHLLKQSDQRARLLYLLDYHLSQINNTVFRQTMFAEFEHRIHQLGEQGETLTADGLGAVYQELLVKYWGPEVVFDEARSPLTWSRIPHFFYNFYVYQYATAYSAAVALSRRVLGGGTAEREQYLDILRSGCSRYPVETIALGGVDMATSRPLEDVVALFGELVDRVEALLDGADLPEDA